MHQNNIHYTYMSKVVCGVNSAEDIWCADQNIENNPNWFQVPGKLIDVSVSNGKLYGTQSNGNIFYADDYKNARWVQIGGVLSKVSLDGNVVCGVNSTQDVYCADQNIADQNPGWFRVGNKKLVDVSLSNGHLYGADADGNLYYADNYKNAQWTKVSGTLQKISLDKNVVCGVGVNNGISEIYCADQNIENNPNWFKVNGSNFKDVSVSNGHLYATDKGDGIYYADDYKNAQWTKVPGALSQVSLGRTTNESSLPSLTSKVKYIRFWQADSFNKTTDEKWLQIGGIELFDQASKKIKLNLIPPGTGTAPLITGEIWPGGNINAPLTSTTPQAFPNIYHSIWPSHITGGGTYSISLDRPKYISKLIYHNRADCCNYRAPGMKVEFYDENKTKIYEIFKNEDGTNAFTPQLTQIFEFQKMWKQVQGMDYGGNDIACYQGASPEKCKTDCEKTQGCVAASIVGNNRCCLKNGLNPNPVSNSAVNTYVTQDTLLPDVEKWSSTTGTNYLSSFIKMISNITNDECKVECAETPGCIATVFNSDNCWLKDTQENPVPSGGTIASFPSSTILPEVQTWKQVQNKLYWGDDLKHIPELNANQCKTQCATVKDCVGAIHDANNNNCWLKKSIPEKKNTGKKKCRFDASEYSKFYPDLQNAFNGNEAQLKQHYITQGIIEGRTPCGDIDNTCKFDAASYSSDYPDLQRAFNGNEAQLKQHYINTGINEARPVCNADNSVIVDPYENANLYVPDGTILPEVKKWKSYPNLEYSGNDLVSMSNVLSPDACNTECVENSQCVATQLTKNNTCILKSKINELPIPNSDMTLYAPPATVVPTTTYEDLLKAQNEIYEKESSTYNSAGRENFDNSKNLENSGKIKELGKEVNKSYILFMIWFIIAIIIIIITVFTVLSENDLNPAVMYILIAFTFYCVYYIFKNVYYIL